ncbi:MAG: tetratricopeptide repeat protein [Candidatus Harrisonbacteria bacterium]|nr:tetratricopeptide repeat protein [Candidatus Harrisonbacteria bacterium]
MKRILLILLLAFLIGIVTWYIWKDFQIAENNSQPAVSSPVITNGLSTSTEVIRSDNQEFKTRALKLVEGPILVKAALGDRARNQAENKIKELTGLIKNNYNDMAAWLDLGAYRKLIGDYEGAAEAWEFVSEIRPQNFVSFHNLGDLYGFYLEDYPKAESNFLKSIENNSANIDAYIQLAAIYEFHYPEKRDQIENLFLTGIKLNPADYNLKIALGNYYKNLGRKAEALQYWGEALKLNPDNKSLQNDISNLKNS